jgi:hypothetical protein
MDEEATKKTERIGGSKIRRTLIEEINVVEVIR